MEGKAPSMVIQPKFKLPWGKKKTQPDANLDKPLPLAPLPEIPVMGQGGLMGELEQENPELLKPLPSTPTPEEVFFNKRKAEREQELQALRGNQQPEPYKGEKGVGKDTRLMVEDPRFKAGYGYERGYGHQPGYKLERESDPKGFFQRMGPKGKKAGKGYLEKQKEEAQADKGYYTAQLVTNNLPVVGSVKHVASTYHESKRQKVNESVASNNNADELTQNIATGLAKDHKTQKVVHGVQTLTSAASSGMTIATAGASLPVDAAVKHGVSAAGPSVTAVGKVPGLLNKDRETRLASVLPQQNGEDASVHEKKVDEANKALVSLGKEDPDFGRAMLTHLSQPLQDQTRSIFSELNSKKGETDTTSGVVEEHTLKPSDVARLSAPEKARLRQRERMKVADNEGNELDLLETLRENEKKKIYENQ